MIMVGPLDLISVRAESVIEGTVGSPILIHPNQTAAIMPDDIKITFSKINDSRCPSDVTCVWAGMVTISIDVQKNDQKMQNIDLTLGGEEISEKDLFHEYTIKLVKIDPYPTSTNQITSDEYVATIILEKTLHYLSPLKQFESGVLPNEIQCKKGLELATRTRDNAPVCLSHHTFAKLVLSGWAKPMDENISSQEQISSENKIVTIADNDGSITLKTGETFLLKLGEGFDWDIKIDNQNVLSRVMNIMVVKGAQGVYAAHDSGTATITGTGNPICLTSNPPCKIHSIPFKLNVMVTNDETNPSGISISTEKDQYQIGDMINFTITNIGNSRIMPNGWGYSIDGMDGKHYAPNGVLNKMLVLLPPGKSINWTWNQLDTNGTNVASGKYTITATYTEENTQRQISNSKIIEIIS